MKIHPVWVRIPVALPLTMNKVEQQIKIGKLTDIVFAALANPTRSVRSKVYRRTSTEVFKKIDNQCRHSIINEMEKYGTLV